MERAEFGFADTLDIGGSIGAAIYKLIGDTVTANITVRHKGAGGVFEVGFAIAPTATIGHALLTDWFWEYVTFNPDADWTSYSVVIRGSILAGVVAGWKDCFRFVHDPAKGIFKGDGTGYIIGNWDDDVYYVLTKAEFDTLVATYS